MTMHDQNPHETDRIVPWHFTKGQIFELPGGRGRGRMERLAFDSGLILYRSEIEIHQDCRITVQDSMREPWLGMMAYVVGEGVMETPNGRRHTVGPDRAIVLRVDRDGTMFDLPGGQVLRHVGVSTTIGALKNRLWDGELPRSLRPFAWEKGNLSVVREVDTPARLRALTASLFTPKVEGPLRLLMLEGVASQILAETINALCAAGEDRAAGSAQWERLALAEVVERVRSDLGEPMLTADLAAEVGLTPSRLERLFREEIGRSLSDFVRGERLAEAHRLLETGGLPIKDVAGRVGYGHVSNFTRAYRDRFGETPARTLRRTLEG